MLASYSASVSQRIRSRQRYPSAAQDAGLEGTARLSFTLGSDGSVQGVSVAGSSGHAELDNAAMEAVRSAAPFPAIPAELNKRSLRLKISLKFFLR